MNEQPNGKIRFLIPKVNNEYIGKLSLRYFGPVVWEIVLPDAYKEIKALGKFKEVIKRWVPHCKCRLCKTFLSVEWDAFDALNVRTLSLLVLLLCLRYFKG